jgi:20S proteasome alpha/beta subunit
MTIAVGFKCVDGIVLGADTEWSVGDSKHTGTKASYLRFPDNKNPLLRVGIVGAGGGGPMLKLVTALKKALKPTMTLDDAEEEIERLAARGETPLER